MGQNLIFPAIFLKYTLSPVCYLPSSQYFTNNIRYTPGGSLNLISDWEVTPKTQMHTHIYTKFLKMYTHNYTLILTRTLIYIQLTSAISNYQGKLEFFEKDIHQHHHITSQHHNTTVVACVPDSKFYKLCQLYYYIYFLVSVWYTG